MPPETGTGKTSDDVSQEWTLLILDYLQKQNRPYSANDVSMNLHNKVTKANATKALKELHRSRRIAGKTSGKQTIYHALQEGSDAAMSQSMTSIDEELQKLREQLGRIKGDEKKAQAELQTLSANPLLCELRHDNSQLEQEITSCLIFLSRNGEDDSCRMSAKEIAHASRDWKLWQKHARIRRHICLDMWHKCSEVVPEGISQKELWESLGLEGEPFH